MGVRLHYFKTNEGSPKVLVRIDIPPEDVGKMTGDRYDPDGWTSVVGLWRLVLDDGSDFDEITRAEAVDIVLHSGYALTKFDEPHTAASSRPTPADRNTHSEFSSDDMMKPELAAMIAAIAHHGQVDKGGEPYVEHCHRVAEGIPDPEAAAVGWLHDVLEDTDWPLERLRTSGLSAHQEAALIAMTRVKGHGRKKETDPEYLARVAAVDMAVIVKRADIADNSDPRRLAGLEPDLRHRLARKALTASDIICELRDVEALGLSAQHPWYANANGDIHTDRIETTSHYTDRVRPRRRTRRAAHRPGTVPPRRCRRLRRGLDAMGCLRARYPPDVREGRWVRDERDRRSGSRRVHRGASLQRMWRIRVVRRTARTQRGRLVAVHLPRSRGGQRVRQ
jgi:hypothetical protein